MHAIELGSEVAQSLLVSHLEVEVYSCWKKILKPQNEMLGNQTETQLWALEMTHIGFRCDDKPIQKKKETRTALNKAATKAQ